MPVKRKPPDDEIAALAEQFRSLWQAGNVLRPWLRKHRQMVVGLVHDDWSWAAIAEALTKAGITYRTARPWHAEGLRREFVRAATPRKKNQRCEVARRICETTEAIGIAAIGNDVVSDSHRSPLYLATSETQASADEFSESEFKPASFIDWDACRDITKEKPSTATAMPATPARSQRYNEIMGQLTGKRPPPY